MYFCNVKQRETVHIKFHNTNKMKKHYRIKIRTHSGKNINVNYFGNEEKLIERFAELAEWHEFSHMAIYEKSKNKPLLTYN